MSKKFTNVALVFKTKKIGKTSRFKGFHRQWKAGNSAALFTLAAEFLATFFSHGNDCFVLGRLLGCMYNTHILKRSTELS